jgi:hypothetical protein
MISVFKGVVGLLVYWFAGSLVRWFVGLLRDPNRISR